MRAALDTNVLAYLEGTEDEEKRRKMIVLMDTIPTERLVVPVQVPGELFDVLVRKRNRPPAIARAAILDWADNVAVQPTSIEIMTKAADLVADHRLAIWDAVIVSAAAEAGCRMLLSEDMQHGFTWGGVTVVNPFAEPPHPLLAGLTA